MNRGAVAEFKNPSCHQVTFLLSYFYSFVETPPTNAVKRNPHVFIGKYITVTLNDDGSLRPNFRPMKVDDDFTVDGYALGVCNELRQALKAL